MFLEVRDTVPQESSMTLIAQTGNDGAMHLRWLGGGPAGTPAVTTRRIWFESPHRLRIDVLHGGQLVRKAVRDGAAWWRWDGSEGESAGDVGQGAAMPPLLSPVLIHPVRLLQTMCFAVTGVGATAGRETLTAAATPRDGPDGGGERLEFEFDAEHGTPLRITKFDSDELTSRTEVTAIDYSPMIAAADFGFEHSGGALPAAGTGAQRSHRVRPDLGNNRRLDGSRVMFVRSQTVWLTGLSGAGKTTIARAIERLLWQMGVTCCVIDGDELRAGLSRDLGHSRQDRGEQTRRAAHVAMMLAEAGVVAIVALISPYATDRAQARKLHELAGLRFTEVWVDTPLEVCAARDTKGLYADAQTGTPVVTGSRLEGDGSGLSGITAPYQAPVAPNLRVPGHGQHPRDSAIQVVEAVMSKSAHTCVLLSPKRA
jgi:adenylylsulfate kinase